MNRRRAPVESWRIAAAIASAAAGGIHLGAVAPHLDEWAPSGLFMLVAGTAQVAWAFAILRSPDRDTVRAGVGLNGAIVGVWALSRTIGLPVGPHAWVPEHVHAGDALATALEALVIVAVVARRAGPAWVRLAAFGALLSPLTTSHGLAHERAVATAALMLAATAFAYRTAAPRLWAQRGREHDSVTHARARPRDVVRPGPGFGAGRLRRRTAGAG